MANSSVMSSSRRRPKRQRTPTTIYTDDNPTTFTTKIKKGQLDNDDIISPRSSSTKVSSRRYISDDSPSYSVPDESMSMPPPAKRGPGRPPRRKSAEKAMSLPGGITRGTGVQSRPTNKTAIPDSSASSSSGSVSSTTATASAAVEQQSSPTVVTKRKRGRPPKNRPKEMPVLNQSMSESDQINTGDSDMNGSNYSTGEGTTNGSSTTPSQDAGIVVDDTNDTEPIGRRSLPESSTSMPLDDKGSSRRSLDSILLSQKKDPKCSAVSSTAIKFVSTRKSNIQRRTKSGASQLLFRARARANSSASWTPPEQDIEGTFINHPVTVAPILPPVLIHDNDADSDAMKTHENGREKLTTQDDEVIYSASESSKIRGELKSKYPVVFDKGVHKASTSIAPPFSSTCQISSGTSSASSSKHKINQSQNQLSQLPTWSPLYNPPVFFEDDYDGETGHLDLSNTIPVTRNITAMTVRKPDNDYLVLGDSVGFVTIYSLGKDNINLPIAQLESMACQQRGKAEQERLRADLLKRKRQTKGNAKGGSGGSKQSSFKYSSTSAFSNSIGARPATPNQTQTGFASRPQHVRSILIDTSDTTIHALGMIENRVVLATSEELECMDVPSGTSLWLCPISSNRFVNSLDMHLNTFDVLVSCSKIDSTEAVAAPISPLMLLQHSKNNVEICDANSPMLVRSPSCTAIWDIGARNRLLFIALSSNRQEHELVLVSGGSIDSWKVACKTKIPTKTSSATSVAAATTLSQSPGGTYTLVASSRGIRLYQTESLQLIHVYGDQLALHGQSVMWKNCWLAGSFFQEKNKNVTKAARGLPSQWLQYDDWLGEKMGETTQSNTANEDHRKNDKTPDLAPYIIGVPHTKGPKELCEKLHVWKVEHPSVVPMMSIPLPHKSEGALGLVGSGNTSSNINSGITEDRIVLVTTDGQGHLLLPKMESNFAGIEYPPGYQVVTDNIEYIEDEEATDNVLADDTREKNNGDDETEDMDVNLLGHGDDDESMDEELREAMRQSLLEHRKHEIALEAMENDVVVDILGTDGEKEKEYLPCRPEPYLRQMINSVADGDETSENETKEEAGVNADVANSCKSSNANGIDGMEPSNIAPVKPKLTDAVFISKILEIMPNMPKTKPLVMEEDCLSFTTTKVVVAVNPVLPARPAARGKKSRAANLETMLKASINPYLQSMMMSRQGIPVNGQGSRLRAASSKSLSLPDNGKKKLKSVAGSFSVDVGTERVNGESHSRSPRHAANDDEAAVVMGLLGLSPCHASEVKSNAFASSDSKDVQVGVSSTNGQPNQVVSASSSGKGVEGLECMTEADVEKSKLKIVDKSCSACRGRLVIHTCGKRSLPIDYEEIARVERDRKQKEEEEKKRIRTEKRRLADQKRREAKKQKQRELEEQRLREEKEQLEAEQRRRLQADFAAQDLNSERRKQIVASYANHISMDGNHQAQARNEMHSVEYATGQTLTSNNGFAQGAQPLERPGPNGQNGIAHEHHRSEKSQSPLAQAALPSISATLASADALVALANLAEHTTNLPVAAESHSAGFGTASNAPAFREPEENQYGVPTFPASHGFSVHASSVNDTASQDFSGEVKRGIPSYASIRGQYSNGNSYSWSGRSDNHD